MLVDASDRIVIAYAVTLNEKRGIYTVQSTDQGRTWSSPVRVFDAAAANWEMVDQPKLTVTEDGKLHILFTQYTLLGGQKAVGLYYSQSADGGSTWTTPEGVIKNSGDWSEIVSFKQTVHRFWLGRNQSISTIYHQVSSDSGLTWSPSATLPSGVSLISEPAISLDGMGKVHFLQIIREDVPSLQEWDWSNERPQLVETRKLGIPREDDQIILDSGITPQGTIYALIQSKKLLPADEVETSVLNISRSLELTEPAQPFSASVSTPSASLIATPVPDSQLIPTQVSPLTNIDDTQSPVVRNIVGLILIVSVVLFILFSMIPRKRKSASQIRLSK
jgi:hypothetical protein